MFELCSIAEWLILLAPTLESSLKVIVVRSSSKTDADMEELVEPP